MSRYTGPRVKVMRALGVDLPGLSPKNSDRRPYRPGQHGNRRHKVTEYGKRLMEKQKVRYNYGLQERQMRRLFQEAFKSKDNTSTKFIELLERRLDNVVFRARFAVSIPSARQLVCHGHVLVNGKRVDIPSYRVRAGDVVSIREKKKECAPVLAGIADQRYLDTSWLEVDRDARSAVVKSLPDESAVLFPLEMQLVVEYYSR